MCIRDRPYVGYEHVVATQTNPSVDIGIASATEQTWDFSNLQASACLLYTSDAADERSSVDLGGRRIIKKKKRKNKNAKTTDIEEERIDQTYTEQYTLSIT